MSTIKSLLDARYGLRTPRLHATVTAVPLVAGRSAGYVIATVGGVGGVRVNVSPDTRAPYATGDTLVVDGVGTPAATEYWASGRIAGARADSDIYQYPEGGTVTISGTPTTLGAGDIVLGSTLTDMSNWWYQYELGRWQIRKGTLMHGAIGDLNSLYGYAVSTYGTAFGQYSAGQVNITTDPTNGFRIRNYETPVFQADTTGVVWALSTFRAGTGDDMVGISATDALWRIYAGNAIPANADFRVDKDGKLYATGATISGALTATTGAIGPWTINSAAIYTGTEDHSGYTANAGDITIYSNGTDASIHAFKFYVDASGVLNAAGATITGTVASDNFVSGTAGWQINNTGSAEFANITARGAIKTAVFEKSLTLAFAGSQITSKSASTVAADVTLSGMTFTLVVRQQAGAAPFANGDLVYLKTETLATYATVNTGSASGANWNYTATYQSGSNAGTVYIGETVIDYGGNGDGRVSITADSTNAPYLSIATHDMTAVPVWVERARLGLLTGIAGASGYGLWTDNGYFTGAVTANSGSIAGFLTIGADGGFYQGTGTAASPTTGLKVWNDTGVGRIAGYNATVLQWSADTDGKLKAGAGAVVLDEDGITLASATSGGDGSLKTKSSTKLIGEYYTGRDGNNDVYGGVDLYNYDATSNVTSSFGVYHSAGLSSRFVSVSTPTTSVNTIIGSKLVLNIRAATGTVFSLQDNFTTEYWGLTNAGTMIGPAWKPAANSTTALQMQKANGDAIITLDTTGGATPATVKIVGNVYASAGYLTKDVVPADFTIPADYTMIYPNMSVPGGITVTVEGTLIDFVLP